MSMAFDILDCSPPVVRMEVVLDSHQTSVLAKEKERWGVVRGSCDKTLTEWVTAREIYPEAILCDEFPKYFA